MRSADGDLPAAPDQNNQSGTDQEKQCHAQQQALSAEVLGHDFGKKAGKDPTRDGAAAHHSENTLGLSRCQHIIRQRPDLGRYQHSEDLHPDVEHRKQQCQMKVIVGQSPEQCAIAGEK